MSSIASPVMMIFDRVVKTCFYILNGFSMVYLCNSSCIGWIAVSTNACVYIYKCICVCVYTCVPLTVYEHANATPHHHGSLSFFFIDPHSADLHWIDCFWFNNGQGSNDS